MTINVNKKPVSEKPQTKPAGQKINHLPFTEEAIKIYLDNCIRFWRNKRDDATEKHFVPERIQAVHYIDCFQSVRTSIFGELLPQ